VRIEDFFAYESFRPNQRELALSIYDNCMDGRTLLAEAMSGFGKTAAVLSGTVSAARERGCRVVYACRTKRQVLRVVEEISLLQKKLPVTAAAMFSKVEYCLLKKTSARSVPQESFGWYCGFNVSNNLCSYFLNVPLLGGDLDRLVRRVSTSLPAHAELLRESEKIHVCPYELTRLAMAQAEVVVVPYNYVFDSKSRAVLLERSAVEPPSTVLVVDEAHNVRDFLKEAQSAQISAREFAGAVREAEELMMDQTASSLRQLHQEVLATLAGAPGWYVSRDSFVRRLSDGRGELWLQNLAFELNACSEAAWHSVAYGRTLPFLILKVGEFLNRVSTAPHDTVLTKWDQNLGLVSTDPVRGFPQFLEQFAGSVLVSATINPSDIFLRSLGLTVPGTNTFVVHAPALTYVRTVIDTGVTTKFKSRTPEMYAKIAGKVVSIATSVNGGVGVFAPSYAVLEPIHEIAAKFLADRNVVLERKGLSGQEANELMESFRLGAASVLFAVQGGRFSEGEDFRDNVMDATVVVGLSLPPPSPQLYAEYASLKQRGEKDSYLMLSLLPALRKAFQSAGRHLRSPGKRGFVFLLDRRFDSSIVKGLMPSWLTGNMTTGDFAAAQTETLVHDFWNS
jgi:DNA excision repair protein ERCC-2